MKKQRPEMAVGFQISPEGTLITYYNDTMKEPMTFNSEGEAGTGLPGITAEELASLGGEIEDITPCADYFRNSLRHVLGTEEFGNLHICVTVSELHDRYWERIPKALTSLGIERRNIFLQDYQSSFFYYTVNQKAELWKGDVALLTWEDNTMNGYVLHVDRNHKPALVTVTRAAHQRIDDSMRENRSDEAWGKERDRLLFEMLKRVFERRNVVTSYLVGDYYSSDWAQRSFQFLIFHRHAFQGNNLFTRGACYCAMERTGYQKESGLLFLGADVISENLGMNMRVRGKDAFFPLINAGINWYEAHRECELICDGEETLTLISTPMEGGESISHVLRLNHMPRRPERATRLRLSVYFTSPGECVAEVEDLGFGELYPSSQSKWRRRIEL